MVSSVVTRSLPSPVLQALNQSDLGLPRATKIVLAITGIFAIILSCGFIAFFVWKYQKFQKHRIKTVRVSSATNDPENSGNSVKSLPAGISEYIALRLQKSWRAPIVMLAGLTLGLTFALGHHVFYSWADRQQVDNVNISQSWILRLGNLFAFTVKLSLSVSIGAAFVQLQWVKFQQQPLRLKDVDALSGILTNILNFGNGLLWIHHPGLLLIAVIYWIMPIVPVLTPGAITVVPTSYEELVQLAVPQLDFNDNWNSSNQPDIGRKGGRRSLALSKLGTSSALLGEILPIRSDLANATYHLNFFGPAIQCYSANTSLLSRITEEINKPAPPKFGPDQPQWVYYSRVAGAKIKDIYIPHCGNDADNLDVTSPDRARLYIMTNGNFRSSTPENKDNTSRLNLTECSLYNASYSINFSYNNTEQTIVIQNITYLHGVPSYQNTAYAALMTTFGSLFVGHITVNDTNISRQCTSIEYLDTGLDFNTFSGWKPLNYFQSSLEEIFQNITISLMSDHAFRKKPSTADLVNVNVTTVQNTYNYNSFGLVATYSIGLLITLVCCLVGLYVCAYSDGSYQNIFSTFIRAAKHSELITENEDTGAGPCPQTLSRSLVNFTTNTIGSTLSSSGLAGQHLVQRKPVLGHRELG